MSQVGKHSISVVYAEKSLEKLLEVFRVLQAICNEEISIIKGSLNDPKHQEKDSFPKIEKVCFKNRVLEDAKKLLDDLSTLPMIHKLISEEKHYF